MMTKEYERNVLARLRAAGDNLAPALGGTRRVKPPEHFPPGALTGAEPVLGGDRKIPTLSEVIREARPSNGRPLGYDGVSFPVAGVTFDNRQAIIAKMTGKETCHIVPEPTNEYDSNALAVHVLTADGLRHVGYVPRDLAALLAPILRGRSVRVTITAITGRGGGWNRGLRIE